MMVGRLNYLSICRGARNVAALLGASNPAVDCVPAVVGGDSVLTHC